MIEPGQGRKHRVPRNPAVPATAGATPGHGIAPRLLATVQETGQRRGRLRGEPDRDALRPGVRPAARFPVDLQPVNGDRAPLLQPCGHRGHVRCCLPVGGRLQPQRYRGGGVKGPHRPGRQLAPVQRGQAFAGLGHGDHAGDPSISAPKSNNASTAGAASCSGAASSCSCSPSASSKGTWAICEALESSQVTSATPPT